MQIPWYIPAIGAAVTWGMHYPLIDFAMKRLSIYGVLLLSVIPIVLLMPLFLRELAGDVAVFKALPGKEQWAILAVSLTSTAGAVLIYLSINNKNATLASLIEITYPVFVILFAYVLFRQIHVNLSVLSGGLMILLGAGLIIYNNQ
jgi:drug/metabolite transporter (DMT)-like permease